MIPAPGRRNFELRNDRTYRLALTFFGLLVCLGLAWVAWQAMQRDAVALGVLLGSGALALGFGIYVEAYRSFFSVKEGRAVLRTLFQHRELNLNEVRGFRAGRNGYLVLEMRRESPEKPLKISQHLGPKETLHEWLRASFEDLDASAGKREHAEALAAVGALQALGVQGGEAELRRLHRIFQILHVAVLAMCAVAFFSPFFGGTALAVAAALLPLPFFLFSYRYPGVIRFDFTRGTSVPSAMYPICASFVTAGVRALYEFHLLHVSEIWMRLFPVSVAVFSLLFFAIPPLQRKIWPLLIYLVASGAYAGGLVLLFNCLLDPATPEVFRVKVLAKHVHAGKHTTFNLALDSWGGEAARTESVSVTFYNSVEAGEQITAERFPGSLGLAWYRLAK